MSTCSPEAIAGHACSCAAVGASNAPSNQSRTAGLKGTGGTPSDYEQPNASSGEPDALGGTSPAPLAHAVLGCAPISRWSLPPGRIALSRNHALVSGLPSSVADWTYLPTGEAPGASIVNSCCGLSRIFALVNSGEPTMYSGAPGVNGPNPSADHTYQADRLPRSSLPGSPSTVGR